MCGYTVRRLATPCLRNCGCSTRDRRSRGESTCSFTREYVQEAQQRCCVQKGTKVRQLSSYSLALSRSAGYARLDRILHRFQLWTRSCLKQLPPSECNVMRAFFTQALSQLATTQQRHSCATFSHNRERGTLRVRGGQQRRHETSRSFALRSSYVYLR